MHNAETEPKFIFDDFSASKPRQLATENNIIYLFIKFFN